MIEGLRIDIKGEELVERIGARVAHHRGKARAYEVQLRKLKKIAPVIEVQNSLAALRARESPEDILERKIREHDDLATALTFLCDHIIECEVYRLDERDLKTAELLPDRFARW